MPDPETGGEYKAGNNFRDHGGDHPGNIVVTDLRIVPDLKLRERILFS